MTKLLEALTLAEEAFVRIIKVSKENPKDPFPSANAAPFESRKGLSAIREAKAELEKLGSEHVAWLRYKSDPTGNKPPRIKLCDSDDPGAFKVFRRAAPAQPVIEPVVRFCPGCGLVGEVDAKYKDCCPDGIKARKIPKDLAEHCRGLFNLAIGNVTPRL